MERSFKLNSTLKFDVCKEKDLISQVEQLMADKKLTLLLNNLLRYALENPELLERVDSSQGRVVIGSTRKEFFDGIKKDISEMKSKIDSVYSKADKISNLVALNKQLGIEQKSKNILQADFILQKQLKDICVDLGISTLGTTYESDRLLRYEEKSQDFIEYVIEHYDGILNEIVLDQRTSVISSENVTHSIEEKEMNSKNKTEVLDIDKNNENSRHNIIENTEIQPQEKNNFEDVDLDSLKNLFGA